MAQVTLYLPDDIAERIRLEAKRSHKSVSAYMADLATRELAPAGWPPGFAELWGSWEGSFPMAEDPPPDEIERLG
jgi:hypothetical protein